MAKLTQIKRFLDRELEVKRISDSSRNGLQVKCKSEVKKIGFAVDGCLSTFEKAKKAKVDLLIVHHGIKWKPQKYIKLTKDRENFLKKNKISLYGAHLPLDRNHKYGHNIGLAKILELSKIKRFGSYHGFKIGYKGIFDKPKTLNQISDILNKELKTKCRIFSFGKTKIKSIGIVSGAGAASIEDNVKEKLDCFLVGEINLGEYNRARDYKLSMIVGGHYATETVGLKLLIPFIKERFNVQTVFIDNKADL
ncbi:Nif3-like dinuclear metal center hexameric protein [Candidatus Woesearchaeota archaeon B3_Woes]|nr:MAG: Nif3-like dinuclear metal center hexameric protein [Candidatus Woesearchaeota archaeon B3_Woes]